MKQLRLCYLRLGFDLVSAVEVFSERHGVVGRVDSGFRLQFDYCLTLIACRKKWLCWHHVRVFAEHGIILLIKLGSSLAAETFLRHETHFCGSCIKTEGDVLPFQLVSKRRWLNLLALETVGGCRFSADLHRSLFEINPKPQLSVGWL